MILTPVDLSDELISKYHERINLENGVFKLSHMRDDPLKFSKFMLGFTPYDYQMLYLDALQSGDDVGVVKARQLGFSTMTALYSLWFGWFNKSPSGALNNTKIGIISKDDDAAKRLLQMIKDFMYMGDKHMSVFLDGRKEHNRNVFTGKIVKSNVEELHLKNGSSFYSLPPTMRARSHSFDLLIIDEFDFMNSPDPRKFYFTACIPTLVATGGQKVVLSTPNGFGGLFYELIDPENKREHHEFTRLFFHHTINKDPTYREYVSKQRGIMTPQEFAQEFEGDFSQSGKNFFVGERVKEVFDNRVGDLDLERGQYVCSVDYGMTDSRTVITLCTEFEGVLYRVYYKEFPSGWDINGVIPFLDGLRDRFRITKVVVDNCPQGDAINKRMVELGWPVVLFDFKKLKGEAYCALRNRVNKHELKMVCDVETEKQFRELVVEESKYGKLMIHKPSGGRDDQVDGIVMACWPYLTSNKRLGVWYV